MMASYTDNNDLHQCLLSTWYHNFTKLTFKTIIISLSQDFVEYLLSDGIVLPEGCELLGSSISHDDDNEKAPSFDELVREILDGIQTLNGSIFPKLNGCSPRDAGWIMCNNTLKCTEVSEVMLLLKSSNIISQILQSSIGKYTLCLREWHDIIVSEEFRCFIKSNHLIGVTQRDCTNCYKHLLDNVNDIISDIIHFYKQNIKHYFPLQNFVMDIYRHKKGEIVIVDFNPFNHMTDSLLFEWEELEQMILGDVPELRLIEGPLMIRPSLVNTSRLPQDVIDLACGNDIHKLINLLEIVRFLT